MCLVTRLSACLLFGQTGRNTSKLNAVPFTSIQEDIYALRKAIWTSSFSHTCPQRCLWKRCNIGLLDVGPLSFFQKRSSSDSTFFLLVLLLLFFFLLQTSSYLQAAFENARKRSWRCIVPEFKRQKIPRMFVLKKEQKSRASVVPRVPPPLPSPLPAEAVCHGVGMDFKETTSGSINSLLCCVVWRRETRGWQLCQICIVPNLSTWTWCENYPKDCIVGIKCCPAPPLPPPLYPPLPPSLPIAVRLYRRTKRKEWEIKPELASY